MLAQVESELGPVDVLVNDAGVSGPSEEVPIWEEDPADWWRVFEVNVLGTYLCCRAVLPGMVERASGRIVNVGSGAHTCRLVRAAVFGTAYARARPPCIASERCWRRNSPAAASPSSRSAPASWCAAMTEWFGDDDPWTRSGAGAAARARARFRARRRPGGPLPARRARRRRGADSARRGDS